VFDGITQIYLNLTQPNKMWQKLFRKVHW